MKQIEALEGTGLTASDPAAACYDALLKATYGGALWPPADTVVSWMGRTEERVRPVVETLSLMGQVVV